MTDHVPFPAYWVDSWQFESVLAKANDLHRSPRNGVRFHIPEGCKIMVDAGVRLLSLANQLQQVGKHVVLDFDEGEEDVFNYLNRMGFFDLLHSRVEVRPQRPTFSSADLHRGGNQNLVEFAAICPDEQDMELPGLLADALEQAVSHRYDRKKLGDAAFTVFAELIGNIFRHSRTELDGYAALQVYQNGGRVKVVVSDSGEGIVNTLRPALEDEGSPYAQLSNADLVVEAFRRGLSRCGDGCGLKVSAQHAIRFRANLEVRLTDCYVRLVPSQNNHTYRPNKAYTVSDLPALWGTHIVFDFFLDN